MERLIDDDRRLRREYSAAFKASVLEQTRKRGASVAGVALRHGLHPNMVHRWLREQRQIREQGQLSTPAFVPLLPPAAVADEHFAVPGIPAPTPANYAGEAIRIEVQRAGTTVTMNWPVTAAAHCAQALRELLR